MGATHVVLIRGINVGGKNKVPMAELRSSLEDAGLSHVRTYIQSGNVLVDAPGASTGEVGDTVRRVLRDRFDVDTPVVTVPAEDLRSAVTDAPHGFGEDDAYRWDVVFLRETLSAEDAFAAVELRDGVDLAWQGTAVVYIRRLVSQASRSYMSRLVSRPEYKHMTIRNWRTTTTLAGMLDS